LHHDGWIFFRKIKNLPAILKPLNGRLPLLLPMSVRIILVACYGTNKLSLILSMKNRTLVIGDIHGAYLALQQVLKRAEINENDTLIFLGDYVDGWSQSCEVIEYLIQLNNRYHCIFIKGNHDAWCEEWLETGNTYDAWLFHGGVQTLASYENASEETIINHLQFFNRMLNYYVDAQNNLFIHAGYASMNGPEKEMYISNYRWDRTLWEMALSMDKQVKRDSKFYPKRLKLYREIFIGHTPTVNYDTDVPMNAVNVWNIDTGAAFNGKLTIMDAETKVFWQSDAVQTLYPDEKGRNRD
jgi:serine/threonine protein phosphatase 1